MEGSDIKRLNIRTKEVVTDSNYLYIILNKVEFRQGEIQTRQDADNKNLTQGAMKQGIKEQKTRRLTPCHHQLCRQSYYTACPILASSGMDPSESALVI